MEGWFIDVKGAQSSPCLRLKAKAHNTNRRHLSYKQVASAETRTEKYSFKLYRWHWWREHEVQTTTQVPEACYHTAAPAIRYV